MCYLVRKIERNKWSCFSEQYLQNNIISSHPITNDLKVDRNNGLSLWEVDISNPTSIDNIALAIASTRSNLKNLDLLILNKSSLDEKGLVMKPTPGNSVFVRLNESHVDLTVIDISDIEKISREMFEIVDDKEYCIRYTENKLIRLFIDKIQAGEISLDNLEESISKKIKKKMTRNMT